MTKGLVAAALIITTISVAQGSLLYAAAMPSGSAPATTHELGPAGDPVLAAASLVLSGSAASDTPIECLRGGNYCFGYGTWNCCGELWALAIISGAYGNFFGVVLATAAYLQYC